MLVAFSSPVTFSKIVFSDVKFLAKFEVVLKFLSVVANHSHHRFFYRKLSSDAALGPYALRIIP